MRPAARTIPTPRSRDLALLACLLPALASADVVERYEPAPPFLCQVPFWCVEEYESFVIRALDFGTPRSRAELFDDLRAIESDKRLRISELLLDADLDRERYRAELIEGMNLGFLLDGLEQRRLEFTVLRELRTSARTEIELLLEDPFVGPFTALLVLPPNPAGPLPAVLALPGHGDHAAIFLEQQYGDDMVSRGYAVLSIDLRADGGGPWEDAAAIHLLQHGFHLGGLHAYEAMLGRKLLRAWPGIDRERIALTGHSGGSMTALMAASVDDDWAALSLDHVSTFHEVQVDPRGEAILCETEPALYRIHPQLEKLEHLAMPVKRWEYGFPEGSDAVLGWLDSLLQPQ